MALDNRALGDENLLASIKGQMEANRKGHDDYVAARTAGDRAGMDQNQPSFNAFEAYAEQYRQEASRLGITDEPEVPLAATAPAERDIGKVPKKADPEFKGPVPGGA